MSAKHTEAEFQALLQRLDLALEASNIGVWEHGLSRDVITWDARMHKLYGTLPGTGVMPGDIWMAALHPDDAAAAAEDFAAAIARKGNYHSQFRIVWPDGQVRHIRSMANYYYDPSGEPALIGVEWDVTADVELNRALAYQQQIAEERAAALQASRAKIEYAAEHDYLTGLPNRRSFDRQCRQLAEDVSVVQLAVMHIDLDRFKQINDDWGHEAGDLVLRRTAEAINAALQPGDFAARMGGDEFVIVAVNYGAADDLATRAETIIARLAEGVDYRGENFSVGASIGIALEGSGHVEAMLKDADQALYNAKRLGRGQVRFYSPAADQAHARAARHATDLAHAIQAGHIIPHYQVQYDARTRALVGLEALARWDDGAGSVLLAEEFLPLARDSGLLERLDAAILTQVLEDIRAWQACGYEVPKISLNLSPERLSSPLLLKALDGRALAREQLCFELRAADGLHDMAPRTLDNIKGLKALGIEIAMSGLSEPEASIMALLRVRPDRLKLDKRLIWPLTSDQQQLHLIHSLVDLARTFGMKVTAEGIECADHAEILCNLGCDTLQGHGFGYPMPMADVPLNSAPAKRDFKG